MCPCMSISFFSRSRFFPSACACVYACLCDCYNCSYLYVFVPPFNLIFDVVSFKSVSIYLGAVENQRELCGQSIGHSLPSSLHHVHQYLLLLHLKKRIVRTTQCRAIFEHNHGFLMQTLKGSGMPKLMNIQMELRKCCNHPFLINGVEQNEMVSYNLFN